MWPTKPACPMAGRTRALSVGQLRKLAEAETSQTARGTGLKAVFVLRTNMYGQPQCNRLLWRARRREQEVGPAYQPHRRDKRPHHKSSGNRNTNGHFQLVVFFVRDLGIMRKLCGRHLGFCLGVLFLPSITDSGEAAFAYTVRRIKLGTFSNYLPRSLRPRSQIPLGSHQSPYPHPPPLPGIISANGMGILH